MFDIDRKSGIPIYAQVKNQIMADIKNGELRVGDKMPTERELSQRLCTSRNTISTAYNQLETEGVLISYQGRGTFVAEEAKPWKAYDRRGKLMRLIDMSFEEALEMGIDSKEFLALAEERIKEKERFLKEASAVFVECNIEQASTFAAELSKWTNIQVQPLVLQELESKSEQMAKQLSEAQMIIATFNHVNEVRELTVHLKKDVFGVAITPSMEAIVKIAKYPRDTNFGLICISREFQFKVENALGTAGLSSLSISGSISRDQEELMEVIEQSDVVIVSPGRREEVVKLAKLRQKKLKEIISFDYNLDQDSVKAILSKFIEARTNYE